MKITGNTFVRQGLNKWTQIVGYFKAGFSHDPNRSNYLAPCVTRDREMEGRRGETCDAKLATTFPGRSHKERLIRDNLEQSIPVLACSFWLFKHRETSPFE